MQDRGKLIRKHYNYKWLAILIGVIIVISFIIILCKFRTSHTIIDVHFCEEVENIVVEITEWRDEGFQAIVVNESSSDTFSAGTNLTVAFDAETNIILEDGTYFDYDPYNPQARGIGWDTGTIVNIEFKAYEKSKNYSRVYPLVVELHYQKE